MRSILFVLGLLAVGLVAAIRLLPWWGLVALLVGLVLGVPVLLKWGFVRALKAPFRAKGAVLRGAAVRVHAIERILAPELDVASEAVGDADLEREHYRLEVTISPRPATGPFRLWEPGELRLEGPGASAEEPDTDDEVCRLLGLEVEEDGRFAADSGMKYEGPQRLRMTLAARPGVDRLQFRYYFELFGAVTLPPALVGTVRSPR